MTKKSPLPGQRQVNVEIPAELDAIYANFVIVSHSASEVVLDFARVLPNAPKAKVHARILMTPLNAKMLLRALGENLGRYEEKYGEIKLPREEEERPIGFRH